MKTDSSPTLPKSLVSLLRERPSSFVLDNGLEVVHQQKRALPLVSCQVWVKTGSIHEHDQPGSGLSHFLEHMLFKGTGKREPGQIAAEVQAFGGQINAYTSFDRTVYYIDGPSESLENILDILSDQTLNASLPEEEMIKEKNVILREIDMTMDDPDRQVSRSLFSTAFRKSPFRYPVIGFRPLFEKVDRSILEKYYRERYQPNNMVLVICGDFDAELLQEQVDKAFGSFPIGSLKPISVAAEPGQLARRKSLAYGDYGIVRGLMGFKVPSLRDKGSPAMSILASIIGSGHSGRLRQRLREDLELVHGISASLWNPYDPGLFIVQYQADPDKAAAAEEAIHDFLGEICADGFSSEDIEKAQRFALVSEIHSRKTISGLAGRLGLLSAVIDDLDYPHRYFERIYQVTPEEIRESAKTSFDQNVLSVSLLSPKTARPQQIQHRNGNNLPAFEERTLSNGARIFWQVDTTLPRTWIRFAAHGGPVHENPSERGATALMATLLNRDTKFKSAKEIAEDLESRGGFMMESSGNNTFMLAAEVMPEDQLHAVNVLHDALIHPAFLETTIEREKACQAAEVKEMHDEILDYGKLRLRQHFFGDHAFASHPYGTLETIEKLSADTMSAVRGKLMTGSRAVMVATGDFDESVILPQLESLMSRLPESTETSIPQPPQLPGSTGTIHEHMDREQSVVFQAFPDVGISPDKALIAELLDEIFSDMSGSLFTSVREKQSLAYFVGASRILAPEFGCFFLYAGTHPDASDRVLQCFDNEIQRIINGDISLDEIASARTRLTVSSRFSLQSPSNRANKVALNALYGKAPMAWLDYSERLDAIRKEDIVQFAADHFNSDKSLRLVITPK